MLIGAEASTRKPNGLNAKRPDCGADGAFDT
jgi:hypothetical protein